MPGPGVALTGALLGVALCVALLVPGPALAAFKHRDDRRHIEATVGALRLAPPTVPVVYLLGGSSARESVTTEPAWQKEIAALGGGKVSAFNFGAASQSYARDIEVVKALPAVPTIVLIGLNVGRYTLRPVHRLGTSAVLYPPPERYPGAAAVYDSHRFHEGRQHPDEQKREKVAKWMRDRFPIFTARYAENREALRRLITLCEERGFHAVLVELPVNLPVIGAAWDPARQRYQDDCREAARVAGIPYVDFGADIGLVSSDFNDLAHLVEPGRAKYQRALSELVAAQLEEHGLTDWSVDPLTVLLGQVGPFAKTTFPFEAS